MNRNDEVMVSAPYVPWSPIVRRQRLEWPGGAKVAVVVMVTIEHVEWLPGAGAEIPRSAVHRGPYPSYPDIHEVSPHEYGNRVGVFRIIQLLDQLGIPASVPIDASAARHFPYLVEECARRHWEFLGHGPTSSGLITATMSEQDEQGYLTSALSGLSEVLGYQPRGWSGVEYGESSRTPALLDGAGIQYLCDWANDDQPYQMAPLEIVSLPVAVELDDVMGHRLRGVPYPRLAQMMIDAVDQLSADGEDGGRVLVLNVHPWLSGHPWRFVHLRRALEHVAAKDDVWAARAGDVVDHFRTQVTLQPR